MKKWIRPVVAGVAALSLAIGGLYLGQRLAAPTAVAASEWVTAQSVQPLSGAEPPADWADEVPLDESASTVDVPLGEDVSLEQARLEEYLDAVSASTSPAAEAEELLPILDLGGDPCALPAAGAECPEGLESTVLGIRDLSSLAVKIRSASTPTSYSYPNCPDPFSTAGTTYLAVSTNQPATVSVSYWNANGSEAARSSTEGTTEEAATEWGAAYDARGPFSKVPSVSTCIPIAGVDANTAYSARVVVTVPNGSVDQLMTAFNSSGNPVEPRASFFAPTDDLVVVIVPHLPGQSVESYVNVIGPGEDGACSYRPQGIDNTARHLGADRHYTLTPEQVAAQNVIIDYSERTTIAYALNEGVTAVVCVRVRSGDAPYSYEASAVVRTADRLTPVVSLWGAAVWDGAERHPTVRSYLANGRPCGTWQAPSNGGRTWNEYGDPLAYLCDFAGLTGSAGATDVREPTGMLPYSFGTLGRFTVVWDDNEGDDAPAAFSLDLGAMSTCTGSCSAPVDSYYRVGDGHSGVGIIRLSWTQGSTNGVSRTTFSKLSDDDEFSTTPFAYLDPESGFRTVTEDSWTFSYARSLQLSANMEGTFSAQLVPAGPSTTLCTRGPSAVTSATGTLGTIGDRWTAWTSVEFTGLCYGEGYEAIVTLTNAAGVTSEWRPNAAASGYLWANGRAPAIAATVPLVISYELHESHPEQNSVAGWFTLRANNSTVLGPYEGYCFGENSHLVSERLYVSAPAAGTVRITGELYSLYGTIDHGICTGEFITALTDPQPFLADVSYAALEAAGPEGIVIQVGRSGPGGLSVHWVDATIRVAIAS